MGLQLRNRAVPSAARDNVGLCGTYPGSTSPNHDAEMVSALTDPDPGSAHNVNQQFCLFSGGSWGSGPALSNNVRLDSNHQICGNSRHLSPHVWKWNVCLNLRSRIYPSPGSLLHFGQRLIYFPEFLHSHSPSLRDRLALHSYSSLFPPCGRLNSFISPPNSFNGFTRWCSCPRMVGLRWPAGVNWSKLTSSLKMVKNYQYSSTSTVKDFHLQPFLQRYNVFLWFPLQLWWRGWSKI